MKTLSLEPLDFRDDEEIMRAELMEELLSIALDDQSPERHVKISSKLNSKDAAELTKAL